MTQRQQHRIIFFFLYENKLLEHLERATRQSIKLYPQDIYKAIKTKQSKATKHAHTNVL